MTHQLELVLSDQELRDELIQKGIENVKRFSWEKSAKQILKIIKENT
jgi:glycosyltransferase involved in cell wall biosynthesis